MRGTLVATGVKNIFYSIILKRLNKQIKGNLGLSRIMRLFILAAFVIATCIIKLTIDLASYDYDYAITNFLSNKDQQLNLTMSGLFLLLFCTYFIRKENYIFTFYHDKLSIKNFVFGTEIYYQYLEIKTIKISGFSESEIIIPKLQGININIIFSNSEVEQSRIIKVYNLSTKDINHLVQTLNNNKVSVQI